MKTKLINVGLWVLAFLRAAWGFYYFKTPCSDEFLDITHELKAYCVPYTIFMYLSMVIGDFAIFYRIEVNIISLLGEVCMIYKYFGLVKDIFLYTFFVYKGVGLFIYHCMPSRLENKPVEVIDITKHEENNLHFRDTQPSIFGDLKSFCEKTIKDIADKKRSASVDRGTQVSKKKKDDGPFFMEIIEENVMNTPNTRGISNKKKFIK